MGKMYTLDKKLLCGSPEIKIGDKLYAVDDRQKTVKKAMKIFNDSKEKADDSEKIDELLRLAFGEKFNEIDNMNMPFSAYSKLAEIVMSAMIGEEQQQKDDTFQE